MTLGVAALAATATLAPIASSQAAKPLTTLKIIGVSSTTEGLLTVAQKQGYLAAAGLKVQWTSAVSGAAVVTAVGAGQYDLGYTADTPPISAYANGAPLHYVVGQDTVGPAGSNYLAFVKHSSPITSWSNLATSAVNVETNAPHSMLSLAVEDSVYKATNSMTDVNNITIVPGASLALTGEDVLTGAVNVGVMFFPYAADVQRTTDLRNLGDPLAYAFAQGTPEAMFFTSSSEWHGSKGKELKAFAAAMSKAIAWSNKTSNHSTMLKLGLKATGESSADLPLIPWAPFNAKITAATLRPVVNAMVRVGWLGSAPNLNNFFN